MPRLNADRSFGLKVCTGRPPPVINRYRKRPSSPYGKGVSKGRGDTAPREIGPGANAPVEKVQEVQDLKNLVQAALPLKKLVVSPLSKRVIERQPTGHPTEEYSLGTLSFGLQRLESINL